MDDQNVSFGRIFVKKFLKSRGFATRRSITFNVPGIGLSF